MTDPRYPCTHMQHYAEFECETHPDLSECPDALVLYDPRFDEYGIPIKDGGPSRSILSYCPWCGVSLPKSKRDAWFSALEQRGIDAWEDEIPEPYRSDAWWRNSRT